MWGLILFFKNLIVLGINYFISTYIIVVLAEGGGGVRFQIINVEVGEGLVSIWEGSLTLPLMICTVVSPKEYKGYSIDLKYAIS